MKKISIMVVLFIFILACDIDIFSEKTDTSDILVPTQEPMGQIIRDDIPVPSSLVCYLKDLGDNFIQAEAVFKNSDIRSYGHRKIAGYGFIWHLYNDRTEGFIMPEHIEEKIAGTSIIFNKQNIDTGIYFEVNVDYNDFISRFAKIECK